MEKLTQELAQAMIKRDQAKEHGDMKSWNNHCLEIHAIIQQAMELRK